jgi:ABC-2 type transport system permease protein
MYSPARAIVWAQWRSIRNRFPANKGWLPVTLIIGMLWYGAWAVAAWAVMSICRSLSPGKLIEFLGPSLLLALAYWQVIPVLMATTGLSLELKRLIVYPVPYIQLFNLEAILRITTAIEMMMVTTGALLGLLQNRRVPLWGALAVVLFMVMNLYVSVGLRDLLTRMLAHRRLREVLAVGLVILTALPQLLVYSNRPGDLKWIRGLPDTVWLPWTAAAHFAAGVDVLPSLVSLLLWTTAGYWFGRSQFERNLRFDAAEAGAPKSTESERPGMMDRFFRLPLLLPDPLGALVEKELRSLARSPRFRLTFIMGFSFGLLIWLPMAFRRGEAPGYLSDHFLTAVNVYALMLLGDVCVWNIFGFDRQAVQNYFALPIKLSTVLRAKNIAAMVFFGLEFVAILVVCVAFRLNLTASHFIEACTVAATFAVFLLGIGNLISVRNPNPVNPTQSWRRTSAGNVQSFLFVVYLVFSAPIGLAFLARYAFDSETAFYVVMTINLIIGCVVYWVSLDSALDHAMRNKEHLISRLSGTENPIG